MRGTNCTRHGNTQKSPPGNHSVHIDSPEDRARFPHHETSGRSRSCRTYQEPPSEKHPESPKSSPQDTRCAATGLCYGRFDTLALSNSQFEISSHFGESLTFIDLVTNNRLAFSASLNSTSAPKAFSKTNLDSTNL